MATPPDVIAGEVIEVEWGNAVRDWAVSTVLVGVASDTSSVAATSSFVSGASVTFVKPAAWVTFDLLAWGSVMGRHDSGGTASLQIVVDIGGNDGTAVLADSAVAGSGLTCVANHVRTGLSADTAVAVQFREVSGQVQKASSVVHYLAIRKT